MQIYNSRKWMIAAGILPAAVMYTLFAIVPIVGAAYFSFFKWDGFSPREWIALSNYEVLIRDPIFWRSIRNNLTFTATNLVFILPLALYFSVILNSRILRKPGLFRTIIFMPVVISTVVISLIWNLVFNYQMGLINTVLQQLGLEHWARNWLGDPNTAIFLLCFVVIWQFTGLYVVIFLSALQSVSSEVLEAAELDGAVGFRKTRTIVVPMIANTVYACLVLCISGSLRAFDLVYVMTKGGPNYATEVSATYMFGQTFNSMKYGYGSAISVATLVISFLLIGLSGLVVKKIQR